MADKNSDTTNTTATVEWTVTGMDCAACATKIKNAVGRLPGVTDVNVAIMAERLKLTLADGTTPSEKIEGAVRSLGYQIEPRKAGAKKDFVLPGAVPEDDHDEAEGHSHDDGHDHDHDDAGQDHSGHDHSEEDHAKHDHACLLYTSPSPRDRG